jgi:uncharacterized protein YcbK (DUF882 family)
VRGRWKRREVLRAAGAAAALGLVPFRAFAASAPRSLSFESLHTGERLSVVYREADGYLPDALARLDHLLRDHRTGEVHPIAPSLFDLLADVKQLLGASGPYYVVSGFRSRATNDMLRGRSGGVARGSLHLVGQAVDVRLRGAETRALREAAMSLARGGVGFYPGPDFVHLDVGRVRTW